MVDQRASPPIQLESRPRANAQLAQAMASYAPSAAPPAANDPIAATQVSPASPLIAAPHPS